MNENDRQEPSNTQVTQPVQQIHSCLPTRLSYLAQWIMLISDSEIAVWWCARQTRLHPYITENIMLWNQKRKLKPSIREAWSLTLEVFRAPFKHKDSLFLLKCESKRFGWSHSLVRRYVALLQPCLVSDAINPKSLQIPPQFGYKYHRQDLAHFDTKYEEHTEPDIVETIPVEYLRFLAEELLNCIQYALLLERKVKGKGIENLILSFISLETQRSNDTYDLGIISLSAQNSKKPEKKLDMGGVFRVL